MGDEGERNESWGGRWWVFGRKFSKFVYLLVLRYSNVRGDPYNSVGGEVRADNFLQVIDDRVARFAVGESCDKGETVGEDEVMFGGCGVRCDC